MKAHQRIIREEKEREHKNQPKDPLFGTWWEDNHRCTDIKKAEIKEITYQEASPIIFKYEWLGTMPTFCTHYFGIYFNNECGGVVVYGISLPKAVFKNLFNGKFEDKIRVLSRGACVWWAHPHSGSRLISESLKILSKKGYKAVLAYCDTRAGEIGTIYQACNFLYIGASSGGYEYFIEGRWRTGKGASHYSHRKRDLSLYKKRERSKKHKYIYLLGSKKEKKEMMKILEPRIKPYPKRKIGMVETIIKQNIKEL